MNDPAVLAQDADLVRDLAVDLGDDGVAVRDANVDEVALDRAQDAASSDLGTIAVVVLDTEPADGAEALANALADETGGTVLVYTPSTVAAASRTESDGAVEAALSVGGLEDPVEGVGVFAGEFAPGGVGAGTILVLALLVVVPAAVVGRWWERRRAARVDERTLAALAVPVRESLDQASDHVLDLDGQTLVAGDAVDERFRALATDYREQRARSEVRPSTRGEAEQWHREAIQLVEELAEVRIAVDTAAGPRDDR